MGSNESAAYAVDRMPRGRVLDAVADWLERVFLPPRHPPRRAQLAGLLRVTDDLLCLTEVVDDVVRRCGARGPVPGRVARRALHAEVWCGRLRDELADLAVEPALAWYHDELAVALDHRIFLLRAARALAFPNDALLRADDARSGLRGIGPGRTGVEAIQLLRAQLVLALS